MSKYKKRKKNKEEREHEEFILEQVRGYGRQPAFPPSKYHANEKTDRRKDRKHNKKDLRQLVDECNN